MNLGSRAVAAGVAFAALAAVAAVSAPPAQARWHFHSDLGETIVAPPGGTRADTCQGRLRAVTGWRTHVEGSQDPATVPVSPSALSSTAYQVWKAPVGFTSSDHTFQESDAGEVVVSGPDGTARPATLVGATTAPARRLLAAPIPMSSGHAPSSMFVVATAPFSVDLTGVRAGDLLALAPRVGANGIFVEVRAMDCSLPVRGARVDLLPGSADNVVNPHVETDLLPVRIFGSRRLDVRQLERVRLGEAAPVAVRAPRDHDRDGRADRVYVFAQGDTDIQCLDSRVTVTGRTGNRGRISARSPILPAGCAG